MNKQEFIKKLLDELSYRVDEGMPILSNPRHIQTLSEILDDWGLYSIKNELIRNLVGEEVDGNPNDDNKYETPILNKEIEYETPDGERKTGKVGDLLRTGEDRDSREQAEKWVPEKGTPERDKIDDDLGDEGKPTDGEPKFDEENSEPDEEEFVDDEEFVEEPEQGMSIKRDKDTLSRYETERQAAKLDDRDRNESILIEAEFNTTELAKSKYQSQWIEFIENGKKFQLEPSGEIVIDKKFLDSTGFGNQTFRELMSGGSSDEIAEFFKDGRYYEPIIPAEDGKKYSLTDISKSTFTGQGGGKIPTTADAYEAGICVEYNKSKGMPIDAAFKTAGVDPDKYEKYEEHLTKVCSKVIDNLPSMGSYLRQTGGESHSPASVWPSRDGTPKTDIFGGTQWRLSLKKSGGSQLVSGKKEDAQGIFQAGLTFYEKYDNPSAQKHLQKVLDSIERDFKSYNTDNGVGKIRKDAGKAYVEWRVPQIKRETDTRNSTDIEKHAKAEAISVGIIGARGKWEEWFLEDVDILEERDIMKWFDTYWKSKGTKELQEEARDIIQTAIDHNRLDADVKKAFDDDNFKKWCVFEASSGTYKFSGTADVNSVDDPIANKIVVFDLDGTAKVTDINENWARGYSSNVTPTVTFKSSGRQKYTAMRLIQESDENETITFSNDLYDIITEESENLNRYINESIEEFDTLLTEIDFRSMMNKVKRIAKRLMNKIRDSITRFYDNVIKRSLNKLKDWASLGIRKFLEYLGIEVDGTAKVQINF